MIHRMTERKMISYTLKMDFKKDNFWRQIKPSTCTVMFIEGKHYNASYKFTLNTVHLTAT